MPQAAIILVMLLTVVATIATTRLNRDDGLMLVIGVAGLATGMLVLLGADPTETISSITPLLLIIGYACLAGLLTVCGVAGKLADKLGKGPLPVLLVAAAASVLLSNDIVIVTFAPIIFMRKNKIVDGAALFVGANITGGLLPQGSPTNLLLLGEKTFFEYLQISLPITIAMVVPAIIVFWFIGKNLDRVTDKLGDGDKVAGAENNDSEVGAAVRGSETTTGNAIALYEPDRTQNDPQEHGMWSTTQKVLAGIAVAAVVAQPVADLFGMPRAVLGWVLIMLSAIVAKIVNQKSGKIISAAPWEIGAVVLVLATGAKLLVGQETFVGGDFAFGALTFIVSSFGTDILAATLAGASEGINVKVALVAVTAGAFTTPVASISGILLLEEYRLGNVKASASMFLLAGGVAIVVWVCGTLVALTI